MSPLLEIDPEAFTHYPTFLREYDRTHGGALRHVGARATPVPDAPLPSLDDDCDDDTLATEVRP